MRKLFVVAAAIVAAALGHASAAVADDDAAVRCTGALSGRIDADVVVPRGAVCELTAARVDGDVVVKAQARLDALRSRIEGDVECFAGPSDAGFFCDILSGTVVEGDGEAQKGGELHLHGGHLLGEAEAGPGSVFSTSPQLEGLPPATALVGEEVECDRCVFLDLIASHIGDSVSIKGESQGSFIAEGNEIAGGVKLVGSAAGDFAFVITDNTIRRGVTFKRNTGPAVIAGNTIAGKLRVLRNRSQGEFCFDPADPASCIEGLTVADNTVGKALVCRGNDPAPTGGGNTADRKKGQCRTL